MSKRNEHLVVIMLEQVALDRQFEIWPLKITLVPWFPVDDEEQLDKVLSQIASRHKNFEVKADRIEQWGNKEKFQVQRIDDHGELYKLHRDVYRSLEKNGFPIHQKDFLGEKFKPHVTLRNRLQVGKSYEEGKSIPIKSFSLVSQIRLKKTGRMIKKLVKDYKLQ